MSYLYIFVPYYSCQYNGYHKDTVLITIGFLVNIESCKLFTHELSMHVQGVTDSPSVLTRCVCVSIRSCIRLWACVCAYIYIYIGCVGCVHVYMCVHTDRDEYIIYSDMYCGLLSGAIITVKKYYISPSRPGSSTLFVYIQFHSDLIWTLTTCTSNVCFWFVTG